MTSIMADTADNASGRRFQFERDTFAYRHELVWKYRFDPATGAMTTHKADPPPTYYHRCFVMTRAARLFFDHALFDATLPRLEPAAAYRELVRKVIARNPRRTCAPSKRIIIPGFDGLRSFSPAHEAVLKAECGAAWESYFLRSHWRMIFPVSGRFQARMAEKLTHSVAQRGLALVHLFRFPRITINHGIALYRFAESDQQIEFLGYDPNLPDEPVALVYEKGRRVFTFAPNIYWGGGVLSVMEIYCGFPY
jgi:hypothetical protein